MTPTRMDQRIREILRALHAAPADQETALRDELDGLQARRREGLVRLPRVVNRYGERA